MPSSQMRHNCFPQTGPQYAATVPQFSGVPTFDMFQPNQIATSPSTITPNISAQVQQFQRRQEQLMASTQRRLQQEAELRRQLRSGELPGPLHSSTTMALPEVYQHHRMSVPSQFGSHFQQETIQGRSQAHLAGQSTQFREMRLSDTSHDVYPYHNIWQSLGQVPYATALSTNPFRHPSAVEIDQRRQSAPAVVTELKGTQNTTGNYDTVVELGTTAAQTNSSSASFQVNSGNEGSSLEPYSVNNVEKLRYQDGGDEQDLNSNQPSVVENVEESEFPTLEKIFDSWDVADNEWLYSLHTECARPGAVCECGESCCCPGCFTHTNNPGDRGVYNTMLNKLGSILETEKGEEESTLTPCVSSSRKAVDSGNSDAKL